MAETAFRFRFHCPSPLLGKRDENGGILRHKPLLYLDPAMPYLHTPPPPLMIPAGACTLLVLLHFDRVSRVVLSLIFADYTDLYCGKREEEGDV